MAMRAEVGRPPIERDPFHRVSTTRADGVLPTVWKKPGLRDTSGIGSSCNGSVEHRTHGLMYGAQGSLLQGIEFCERMDLRLKEDLVRLDVAEARDNTLIHENRLDDSFFAGQTVLELPPS